MHSASPRGPPPASLPYCHTAVLPYPQHRPRVRESFGHYSVGLHPPLPILHLASCILHHAYPVCEFFEDRCQVPGIRYRVPAIWHLGPGTRHRSRSDAEGRTPSTEDRARPLENAHIGFASCILYPASIPTSPSGAAGTAVPKFPPGPPGQVPIPAGPGVGRPPPPRPSPDRGTPPGCIETPG
jgi:hypothetical protein